MPVKDYDSWLDTFMTFAATARPPPALVTGVLRSFWDHCLRHADNEYDGVYRFRQQVTCWFGDKKARDADPRKGEYLSALSIAMHNLYPDVLEAHKRYMKESREREQP